MKKRFKILMLALLMLASASNLVFAQNDSFFYKMYTETDRDEGLQLDMLYSNEGQGMSFFNMENQLDGDDGFSFGDMEITPDNVPKGSGLALLAGMAFLYMRRRDNKDNND